MRFTDDHPVIVAAGLLAVTQPWTACVVFCTAGSCRWQRSDGQRSARRGKEGTRGGDPPDREFFVDLLCYHTQLHRYVPIELTRASRRHRR